MTTVSDGSGFGSPLRQRIFFWLVFSMAIVYVGRLAYLQIIQGNVYRVKAETQAIKQVKIEPFRGNMIDRNGHYIVQNAPGFSVTVTPYEFNDESCKHLSAILDVPQTQIWQEVRKAATFNKFAAAKIPSGRDVSFEVISAIEEQRDDLPGVDIIIDPKRLYAFDGNAAHLLGYTREVSEWQLKSLGDSYDPGDVTGQTGLEKAYEPFVRGTKGFQFVAVNKSGQRVASFNDGKSDQAALEGSDLYLGLDIELQELAEKLMAGHTGGVVALDPNNGEILCYVSKPDFDLRNFTGKTSRTYYNQIHDDKGVPLFNRVSMPIYPPGSTWKPLMALAGLQEGIITDKSTLYCAGGFTFGNRTCKCHGGVHGAIDVNRAIASSCNAFFNQIAVKLGVERFHQYGSMFGFGQKTRADITEEARGILPSRAYMNKAYGERGWTNYALVNWGIGQGEVQVTPLQMVTYIAAIANEGTLYQPHAVRAMYNKQLKQRQNVSYDSQKIPIENRHFKTVKNAMRQVVTNGTARIADIPGFDVCGKTGTAETKQGDQGWFVCFAPKDNPRIALVVTVERGGFGGVVAAPIVRKLLEKFFLNKWPDDVKRDSTWTKQAGGPATPGQKEGSKPASPAPAPKGPFGVTISEARTTNRE